MCVVFSFLLSFFLCFFLCFQHTLFGELVEACVSLSIFIFKLFVCTYTWLSQNSLISSWISTKFISTLLQCTLSQSNIFQPKITTWINMRESFTLQIDSFYNLNPLQMVCTRFQTHKLYWYMHKSLVTKLIKNMYCHLFKINF